MRRQKRDPETEVFFWPFAVARAVSAPVNRTQGSAMTMHQRLHLKACHDTIAIPLANTLLNLSDNTRCSFHALPLRRGKSIRNSILEGKFAKLFGNLMAAEETVGAPYFDTFLWPQQ